MGYHKDSLCKACRKGRIEVRIGEFKPNFHCTSCGNSFCSGYDGAPYFEAAINKKTGETPLDYVALFWDGSWADGQHVNRSRLGNVVVNPKNAEWLRNSNQAFNEWLKEFKSR